MADVLASDSVKDAIKQVIVGLDVVGDRVWDVMGVPSKPTFPYMTITSITISNLEYQGDASAIQQWNSQYQIDVYHQNAKVVDYGIMRAMTAEFPASMILVNGERCYLRNYSVNRLPASPGETVVRDVLTLFARHPSNAM